MFDQLARVGYLGTLLKGKKTYITAITGILGAVGAYLVGEMSLADAFQVVWPLIAATFLRKGIADK